MYNDEYKINADTRKELEFSLIYSGISNEFNL